MDKFPIRGGVEVLLVNQGGVETRVVASRYQAAWLVCRLNFSLHERLITALMNVCFPLYLVAVACRYGKKIVQSLFIVVNAFSYT